MTRQELCQSVLLGPSALLSQPVHGPIAMMTVPANHHPSQDAGIPTHLALMVNGGRVIPERAPDEYVKNVDGFLQMDWVGYCYHRLPTRLPVEQVIERDMMPRITSKGSGLEYEICLISHLHGEWNPPLIGYVHPPSCILSDVTASDYERTFNAAFLPLTGFTLLLPMVGTDQDFVQEHDCLGNGFMDHDHFNRFIPWYEGTKNELVTAAVQQSQICVHDQHTLLNQQTSFEQRTLSSPLAVANSISASTTMLQQQQDDMQLLSSGGKSPVPRGNHARSTRDRRVRSIGNSSSGSSSSGSGRSTELQLEKQLRDYERTLLSKFVQFKGYLAALRSSSKEPLSDDQWSRLRTVPALMDLALTSLKDTCGHLPPELVDDCIKGVHTVHQRSFMGTMTVPPAVTHANIPPQMNAGPCPTYGAPILPMYGGGVPALAPNNSMGFTM